MTSGWANQTFPILPDNWRTYLPQAVAIVTGYISRSPDTLLVMPNNEIDLGRAWPSPRTWDYAASAIAAIDSLGTKYRDEGKILVTACIGDGAAKPFLNWMAELDLPDPVKLLAHPQSIIPLLEQMRSDVLHTTLTAVCSIALSKGTNEMWKAAWEIVGLAGDKQIAIATMSARQLAKNKPQGAMVPPQAAKFGAALKKAGL